MKLTNLIRFEQAVGKVLLKFDIIPVVDGYFRLFEWEGGQSVLHIPDDENDQSNAVQLVNHDVIKRLLYHHNFIEIYGAEAKIEWDKRFEEEQRRYRYQNYLKLQQEFKE